MRLWVNTMRFTGTITDLKKYLEKKIEEEEFAKLMEEKDREDQEFMMRHQNDNQSFSG